MRPLTPNNTLMWRLVLLLAVVILAMIMLAKCSHNNQSPFASTYRPSLGDTLDIAIEMNPTIYAPRGDTICGKDYDMLMRIAAKHNVPVKFHPFVPLRYALDGLENGDFDMVVASVPATSGLKERFLMSNPVYLDREILVQLVDSATGHGPITSPLQLAGDTLWIADNSPFSARISNLSMEIGDTIFVMSDPDYSAEHLFILTALGQIKLAVVNESVAKAMHQRYPMVDIATPISFTQFQSWAIRKSDQTLLDSINSWLEDFGH